MRWRQFFTPVQSISAEEAREMVETEDDLQILDVRQPNEYKAGHLPGARLAPVGDLNEHLGGLDRDQPVLVYCAIGGRSRVAAQMLAGKGFDKVYNMSGGFKAWNGWTGFGDFEKGLDLFDGAESSAEVLASALGMERALGTFYSRQAEAVENAEASRVFNLLGGVEEKHLNTVAERYSSVSGGAPLPDEEKGVVEGGMTTEEFMNLLGTDPEDPVDVVDFAMSLEAQAMDLYERAAMNAPDEESRSELNRLSSEEKAHLQRLARLMDELQEGAADG